MRALTKRFVRSNRGTAAIEFAMIVPVMLALTAGIVEFGSIFAVYNQTNRLASQYAAAWSDCSDDASGAGTNCQAELNTYTTAAALTNIAPRLIAANLTLQMFQVDMAQSPPQVKYSFPTGSSLSPSQSAVLSGATPAKQKFVLVSATYQHKLMFFPNRMTTFLGSFLNPSYTVVQLKS